MIVCSCNKLSAADVRKCLAGRTGPVTVPEVYRLLGCAPQCGTCARTIYCLIATRDPKSPAEAAAPGLEEASASAG